MHAQAHNKYAILFIYIRLGIVLGSGPSDAFIVTFQIYIYDNFPVDDGEK